MPSKLNPVTTCRPTETWGWWFHVISTWGRREGTDNLNESEAISAGWQNVERERHKETSQWQPVPFLLIFYTDKQKKRKYRNNMAAIGTGGWSNSPVTKKTDWFTTQDTPPTNEIDEPGKIIRKQRLYRLLTGRESGIILICACSLFHEDARRLQLSRNRHTSSVTWSMGRWNDVLWNYSDRKTIDVIVL